MSLWDTNWEPSQGVGKLTERAFNQLRGGCQNRTLGAGRTMPALIAADIPEGGRVTRAHRAALHNEVSALIPLYVNHLLPTATPGNYNGEATIPVFSEATILTAVGDSVRLPVPNDHINAAAWNFQTKKIINLLRWGQISITPVITTPNVKSLYRQNISYSDAISAFNGFGFGYGELPIQYGVGHVVRGNAAGPAASPGFYVHLWRSRFIYTYTNGLTHSLQLQYYTKFIAPSGGIYLNNDYSVSANIFNTLESETTLVPTESHIISVGDINNCSITPSYPDLLGWNISNCTIIKKFDGAGGFPYLD